MKRFLSLLLVAILFASCLLTGCQKNPPVQETTPQETTPQETTPQGTTTDPGNDTPTIPEGHLKLQSVSISSGDTPAELTAAQDLQKYLTQKGVDATAQDGFPISLSIDESRGEDSYRVTASVGENKTEGLAIVGGNGRGILYGVYAFLEEYANVRFFTPELEVCEPGDVIIFDGLSMDYTPAFELRQTDWYRWKTDELGYSWSVKNGINIVNGWNNYTWGEDLGGCLSYAPSMFVHTIGKLAEMDTPYPANAPTPCLTDEDIYNAVLKNVRAVLAQYPTSKILSVSQNDTHSYCKCENCEAITKEEGSPAGTLLRFVNRIANDIAADYPDVTIDTLAYQYTQTPPKITKPAENVCVRLCTITCHFNHPLTKSGCSACEAFCKALEGWSAICDNIYIWDYTTNYSYYLATFPNFHVLRENMKLFAQNNVKGVYAQGNASGPSGEFGELRAYLIGKVLMDPYMSSTEYYQHMDEFLEAYYGDGWTYIRKYIDKTTELAKDGCMNIYENPFTAITGEKYAENEIDFDEIWQKAEELADEDRKENVRRSALQWQYLKLMLHPSLEGSKKLLHDVKSRNILWLERKYEVEEETDLTLSPDHWFDYRYKQ